MLLVQKFGGSSVGTPEKIKKVAARISAVRASGKKLVVVVSAMGDTTDELVSLSSQVTRKEPYLYEREMDMLLSAGERISMALLSMALRDCGVDAVSYTGSQSGIITDESHTRAKILEIKPIRIQEALSQNKVVIVAGFQGVSRSKEITTLGRGGSDTTSVALAVALNADRCEIFTDVKGIYSMDTRKNENAIRYERLPLTIAHELSVWGAQVMHARSLEIAKDNDLEVYVGNAQSSPENQDQEGTYLIPNQDLEEPKVIAVTVKSGLLALSAQSKEDQKKLVDYLEREKPLIHAFEANQQETVVLVEEKENAVLLKQFETLKKNEAFQTVSLVGVLLKQNPVFSAKVLDLADQHQISFERLTMSAQSITVWTKESDQNKLQDWVKSLHKTFLEA